MKGYEEIIKRITALEEQILSGIIKPMNLMEAAAYLGLAPSYIYKLTHKHLIPHYKPTGKRVFFYKKELDQWITSNEDASTSLSMTNKLRTKNEDASTGSTTLTTGSLGMTKEDGSAPRGTKDPRQIEMELKEKKTK